MSKNNSRWALPKFNKWFWVMLAALVVFFIIMGIQWVG